MTWAEAAPTTSPSVSVDAELAVDPAAGLKRSEAVAIKHDAMMTPVGLRHPFARAQLSMIEAVIFHVHSSGTNTPLSKL